jgi:hypothetical protein
MAAITQSEGVPSHRDEIPASSAEDTDIDSPPAQQSSEMAIDKSSDLRHNKSIEEGLADLPMPSPGNRRPIVNLPPLPPGGAESKTPRTFDHNIPDSDAVSDWSPTIDRAKHESEEVYHGEPLNASPIKGSPGRLGVLIDAVPDNLSIHQEASPQAVLNTKEEEKVEDPLPVETKSDIEPETPEIVPRSTLHTEPKTMTTVNPSPENSISEITSTISSHVSLEKGGTSHGDLSNTIRNHPTEKLLPEADPVTTAHYNGLSPNHDAIESNVLKTASGSTSNAIESRSNISYVEAVQAARLSPEEQARSLCPNLLSSSSQARTEEGDSSQTKPTKPPTTPFREPLESQSKDIMKAELKAMKIVGPVISVFLCYPLHPITSHATFIIPTFIHYNATIRITSHLQFVIVFPSVTKLSPSAGNCPETDEIGGSFQGLTV